MSALSLQQPLDLGNELVVDLFAGGGGTSEGLRMGLDRDVDIAVNHDRAAIAMHMANHPNTKHYCESVFKVVPERVTNNEPVGLLWASPDCTHHSKAKGGKPVSNKRRGLAWVVIRWARRVRPRVIMLENVEEFADWGPLTEEGKPCKKRKGKTFRHWVGQLERLGYQVEHRMLRACDYGAPTIRKRLFLIARCDGLPIAWPEPTHGDPESKAVKRGKLLPWRTAAECIDWTIPCPSIFTRKKPLAENTQKRIARGIVRYVLESHGPFLVNLTHGGRLEDADEPFRTITCANRGEKSVVVPIVDTSAPQKGHAALVAAFLAKHYGGNYNGPGSAPVAPLGTVTTKDHNAVVAAHLLSHHGNARRDSEATDPHPAVCAGGTHSSLVASFLAPYYGQGSGLTGRDPREPAPTVTTKERLQLVTVQIDGETYVLADIGMRMLQPRELFRAQGFRDSYIIDVGADGKKLTKSEQVRMAGNSVCPQVAAALVRANFVHEQRFRNAEAA